MYQDSRKSVVILLTTHTWATRRNGHYYHVQSIWFDRAMDQTRCTNTPTSYDYSDRIVCRIDKSLNCRDGNEYWKPYSNIRFTYSNIFEYSFFESKVDIRFKVYRNTCTFPFPLSNNCNFPSISINYFLHILHVC